VAVLSVAGYVLCRGRALTSVSGNVRQLHSLPGYYGWYGFILASVPAVLALAVWLIAQPMLIERQLSGFFPPEMIEDSSARTLLFADVRRVAGGLDVAVAQGALTDAEAEARCCRPRKTTVRWPASALSGGRS
jgi:phosphate transport system permease protein